MVKTTLVGPDLPLGREILRILDKAKFPVTAALWLLEKSRSEDWDLVVATPVYDRLGPRDAYKQLLQALSSEGPVSLVDLPIRLEGIRKPMIRDLRKTSGKAGSVEGERLRLRSLGGTWIDDGYVYRIKPLR
jgi:hypothetical protein